MTIYDTITYTFIALAWFFIIRNFYEAWKLKKLTEKLEESVTVMQTTIDDAYTLDYFNEQRNKLYNGITWINYFIFKINGIEEEFFFKDFASIDNIKKDLELREVISITDDAGRGAILKSNDIVLQIKESKYGLYDEELKQKYYNERSDAIKQNPKFDYYSIPYLYELPRIPPFK